jgi:protein O-GlcNAc transferase
LSGYGAPQDPFGKSLPASWHYLPNVTAFEQGNLAFSLAAQGRLTEAIHAYRAALTLAPDWAEAHYNLGIALRRSGLSQEAIDSYQRTIALKPDFAPAHNNLGNIHRAMRHVDESVGTLRQAVELDPSFAEAWNNLGAALKDRAELDEALYCFDRSLRLAPHRADIASNRIYLLYFHPRYAVGDICREQRDWAHRYASDVPRTSSSPRAKPLNHRSRIGFVSPNFRDHCQSLFMLPLLRHFNREAFEIFCYSDVEVDDHKTVELRAHADSWRPIVGRTDDAVAGVITQDEIDILFDLTQHMANNRLLLFARKPAPIQVAWLGYPGGTGLTTIDYRLTDPHLECPESGPDCYTEKPICLPDTFWSYDPQSDIPVNSLPAFSTRHITFGCLNNFCKINDGVIRQWSKIMSRFPTSRLLLLAPTGTCRSSVIATMKNHGVAPERLSFSEFLPREQYLKLYNQIDITLDTFPYNGHTTSLDSLWMGVPVVTRVGQTPVGRAGLSLLTNLNLVELVGTTEEAFGEAAFRLASDLPKLSALRASLRDRMRQSPLVDAPRFAKNFESICHQMWREKI